MSASLAAVALCNAIIPLLPSFCAEDLRTVKVEHCSTTGNGMNAVNHSYKTYLLMCDDLSNKELLLCVIDQFLDAAHNDRLCVVPSFGTLLGGSMHCLAGNQ